MLGKFSTSANRMSMIARRSMHLAQVSHSDVATCKDSKWMGEYVKAVAMGDDHAHVAHVESWMRQNFRKMSTRQAMDVIEHLGRDTTEKAACFDESFWLWETLEEAVRGDIDSLTTDEFCTLTKAFGANYKGSRDLYDMIENRISLEGAELTL